MTDYVTLSLFYLNTLLIYETSKEKIFLDNVTLNFTKRKVPNKTQGINIGVKSGEAPRGF